MDSCYCQWNSYFGYYFALYKGNLMRGQLLLFTLKTLERWINYLEKSQAVYGRNIYKTNLSAAVFRNGEMVEERDLGSGLVTTAVGNLLAADWQNTTATLKLSKFHDSGTGVTAS